MIQNASFSPGPDSPLTRRAVPWVLCEATPVWRQAVYRFAVPWFAPPAHLDVRSLTLREMPGVARTFARGVVLWGSPDVEPAALIHSLTHWPASRGVWLHILAGEWVSGESLAHCDRAVLSEIGIAASLRSIEELPRIRRLVVGHFARTA